MKKVIFFLLTFLMTQACLKEDDKVYGACEGECDARMIFPTSKENGFYNVELDWSREYLPYFSIDIEASKTHPKWWYNRVSVVSAEFDSNTSWVLGDSLVYSVPNYNPFTGNYTSSGVMLPVKVNDVVLSQFAGTVVNVVQNTSIYFKDNGQNLTSKRVVGPFPPQMIGDTITIYMEVFWDAGMQSEIREYSEQFIVK